MTTTAGEKLTDLNVTLVGIENKLLHKKVDRQDLTIDSALEIINKASEDGHIELSGCESDSEDEQEDTDGADETGGSEEGDVVDDNGDG